MSADPLVSVVIPTYNRPQFIRRAINSCFSQNDVRVEVIVVDDNGKGSDDQKAVESMLTSYTQADNFKYVLHQFNKNGAAARNTGIRVATGEYIAFLDDDDWFEPDKLREQLQQMDKDSTQACLCGFRRLFGKEEVEGIPDNQDLSYRLLLGTVDSCAGSGLIVKKQLAIDINGFQENFLRRQDVEFLYRISKYTNVSVATKILLNVYMHPGNLRKSHINDISGILCFLESFKKDIENYPMLQRDSILDANYLELSKLEIKDKHIGKSLKWLVKSPHSINNFVMLTKSVFSYYSKKSWYSKV